MYESQMAQRRERETAVHDVQKHLSRDAVLKSNFDSDLRVEQMRRARIDQQRESEYQMLQSMEKVGRRWMDCFCGVIAHTLYFVGRTRSSGSGSIGATRSRPRAGTGKAQVGCRS
jgi:hypothetical protein